MCNIFYHVRIVNIVFRMKNCLSHIGINVMDLQSCFTILKFRAVRVWQSRFWIKSFLIPSCHHFQEFRCFLQLIGSHNSWIFCIWIIPQITDSVEGCQSLIFHIHEEDFRCCRVQIDALHFRMRFFDDIAVLFNIFKGLHLSVPFGSLYQVTTIDRTIWIVGRQQGRNTIIASIYCCLLFCFLRLCCKVLRCVGWPELIKALEGTLLRQRCKVQPGCTVCHIKLFSRREQQRIFVCVLRPADPVDFQRAVQFLF